MPVSENASDSCEADLGKLGEKNLEERVPGPENASGSREADLL